MSHVTHSEPGLSMIRVVCFLQENNQSTLEVYQIKEKTRYFIDRFHCHAVKK